jgi:ABC-type phosphate transport system permease subunit
MLRTLLESGDIMEIISVFIALGLIAATILCLIFIIVGGISFILSAGNEDKIKKAVHTNRYSIVGLIVAFIAYFLVLFIARLLDIPFDLSFSKIIDLMQQILNSMSG